MLAISDATFAVQDREFISILGPSGCGKSTLMMIIAGLRPVSSGAVFIDETPVTAPQTDVGIVFQSDVLLDWRNALDNVLLQATIRKLPIENYRDKALQLLHSVGLQGFEQRYPYELSGGMRQRVSICRALVHDPRILLMDEPFGALDALTREQMQEDLQALWMSERKTVVFITHSIPEAVFLSDRVVVMTHRPGQVDAIVPVDLPRPRDEDTMTSREFAHHVREIRRMFRLKKGGGHD
ncbi:MAG TPA: ABC transporter ATP-binding protein [Streptosporangiaceae bacterium]|nr:ABC transporter ATP-binding protein [Streptosporangiaceae bacterium]